MVDGPKQIEIDQISLEDDCASIIKDLRKAERKVNKALSKLIKRDGSALEELKKYKKLMFDSSRNYIQMLNQDSEIIDNQLLILTKEHVKRLEKTIKVKTEMLNTLKELDKTYDEYVNNLSRLRNSWDDLVDRGDSWYDDANDLIKEKNSYGAGGKLGRLEKSMKKNHARLKKAYDQKTRAHQLVETSYNHINQVLQKLKAKIKNIRW